MRKRTKSKIIRIVVISLLSLTAMISSALYYLTYSPKSGTIQLPGLTGPVSITRDQRGVPHIQSQFSDYDVYFALGFVHAQDRFWQMEMQRRIAQGTLSEIFGEAALSKDQFLRTIGFFRVAQQNWQYMDDESRRVIHSYTEGVNAFLSRGKYPLEIRLLRYRPEPWTEIDTLAWSKLMAWDLQNTWQEKINNYLISQRSGSRLEEIFPNYPKSMPTVLSKSEFSVTRSGSAEIAEVAANTSLTEATGEALTEYMKLDQQIRKDLRMLPSASKGSNNWVISGKLTRSGKPILANDPHLRLQVPNLWYLAELKGPHQHAYGATIPGFPIVVLGRNDFISWGVTNINPDAQDLFIEPKDAKLSLRQEIINVRGQAPKTFTVRESKHGPIISDITSAGKISERIAFRWTALNPDDTTVNAFIQINYAHNWQEFKNALKKYVTPSQNFVYADINGNIGYYMPGAIPIRHHKDSRFPVPADGKHEWAGYIPFEKLPHVFNPKKGYIVTANNKIVGDDYPYSLTFRWYTAGYRAQRIEDLIRSHTPHDVDTSLHILADTKSYLWRDLSPLLLKTPTNDQLAANILKELSEWDGIMRTDSRSAAVFGVWYAEIRRVFADALQLPYQNQHNPGPFMIKKALLENSAWCQKAGAKDCLDLQQQTLQRALLILQDKLGNNVNRWKWGKLHKADFSLIGLGQVKPIAWLWHNQIATPGDDYTVNVGPYDVETYTQIEGAGYRQVIDMGNFDNSRYLISMGQSGKPLSYHFNDFIKRWRNVELLKMTSNSNDWGITRALWLKPSKPLKILNQARLWVPVNTNTTSQPAANPNEISR